VHNGSLAKTSAGKPGGVEALTQSKRMGFYTSRFGVGEEFERWRLSLFFLGGFVDGGLSQKCHDLVAGFVGMQAVLAEIFFLGSFGHQPQRKNSRDRGRRDRRGRF